MAADLIRRQVSVIAATGGPAAALAAKRATTTVPIVFVVGSDPVAIGLVSSLNRPGGNLTGVTTLGAELGIKRLQLLHQLVPSMVTVACLINPSNPGAEAHTKEMHATAGEMGLKLHVLHASAPADFDKVFSTLVQAGATGLVIAPDPLFTGWSDHLAKLTVRHAVPAVFQYRKFSAAGGLLGYGGDIAEAFRQTGLYVGRILRGEKPSELPIVQSTKIQMIINLKTAKGQGVTVPPALLARADEIIE
jgi:putative ABC transport system substrate-binding protein